MSLSSPRYLLPVAIISIAPAALSSPGCIDMPPLRNTKSCPTSSSPILAAKSCVISGETSMPLHTKLQQQQILGALRCTMLYCIGRPLTCLHLEDFVQASQVAYQLGCLPHYSCFLDRHRTFAHIALPCRQIPVKRHNPADPEVSTGGPARSDVLLPCE
ncbi:hypothetical protein QBC46DRAFT_43055 [Diplogelasinospora grovesii]|uniref:Uncharacterized protein n=1 Tax=Diplogelasinospora grovesii TaxID=303347 RepID=A0AAN6MY93_9PEZI|nr:hypothetical protein QBC46DRAFT_43055 [Diplogelasinospora grovesii]